MSRETRTWTGALAMIAGGPVAFVAMVVYTSAAGWALVPAMAIETLSLLLAAELLRPRKAVEPQYVTTILDMLHTGKVSVEEADRLLMRSTIIAGEEP